MGNGIKDFKRDFGESMYIQVLTRLYAHNDSLTPDVQEGKIPKDEENQLYYSLLNMIDYECFKYKDAPEGLDEELVKTFLKEHADDVKCRPPTYLGLFCGVYDFMKKDG